MIKPPLYRAIILALFCFACHQAQPGSSGQPAAISKELIGRINIGTYSGHYSKGLLTLAINYISGNIASGYDIHKGLRRNLNGSVEQKGGRLEFVLREPGGNPYDGTFFLSLDTAADKISGKWIPADSSLAKAGPLELVRSTYEHDEITEGEWGGELGALNFLAEGVCTLEYYPEYDSLGLKVPNAQLVTVRGSYEIKGDTVRIDWQRNNRTPTVNMKLIMRPGRDGTDSTESVAPALEGKGVKFNKNMAG
jgi:hypothetical protein